MAGLPHRRWTRLSALITVLLLPAAHAVGAAGLEGWTPLGLDGGRIVALATASREAGSLYAGTSTGVFRSADGGASWTAGDLPAKLVVALAVEADQPEVVYAAINLEGVFKSVDGGQTWKRANTGLIGTTEVLVAHPRARGTLYASTTAGLFRTVDAGEHWTKLRGFPTTVASASATALAADPATTKTLYVGLNEGLLKTTDGGETWIHIGDATLRNWRIDALAVHPTNPSTMYAAAVQFGDGTTGVFRSVDGGATWVNASQGLPAGRRLTAFAIPPKTPALLFAAGLDAGVFRSENGGGQWTRVSDVLSARLLVPDPEASGTLYAAGSGLGTTGVFKTVDAGGNWAFSSRGIRAFGVEALVVDPRTPSIVYAGSTQVGIFKSTDAGQSWQPANQGHPDLAKSRITALAIHPPDSRILYAAASPSVFRTLDGGARWARVGSLNIEVHLLKIDPQDPLIVHAGTWDGIYRSTDGGVTWDKARHPDLSRSFIGDIANDPAAPAVVYAAAFYTGPPECHPCPHDGLLKSTDRGASWELISEGTFIKIAIDPKTPSTLYALGASQKILRSTDGGEHWSPIGTVPTPDLFVVAGLFVDPQVSTTLYLAQATDVLRSLDGGVTWDTWNGGLRSPVTALAFAPSTPGKVLAATSESGVSARLTASGSPCIAGGTQLCLNGDRFRVEVAWKELRGNTGVGKALPLTDDTGAFWFFGSENLELMVKVLDGRALNGKFWVFYGSLTNVEFTLTVTDTATQQQRTYRNPPRNMASAADTGAF